MPRVKKPRKPTIQEAFNALPVLDVVTLNIDVGADSGWSITVLGVCIASGECKLYSDQPPHVVRMALEAAAVAKLASALVCEKPYAGNISTIGGIEAAFGVWKSAWITGGGVKARIFRVRTSTWRSRVLGKGWGNAPREVARPEEQRVAAILNGAAPGNVGEDEAPAVCIGAWAARAPEIAKKLPKGRKPKAATQLAVAA